MNNKQNKGQNVLPMRINDFPAGLREVLNTVKGEEWQQRYLLGTLPCLGSLAERVRARYCFGDEIHALLFHVAVVGHQSSGKGFAKRVSNLLMNDFYLADASEREKKQRYLEAAKIKRKSAEQPEDPLACPRRLQSSASQAFLQVAASNAYRRYGDYLSFFFFNEEATLFARGNQSSWSNLQEIMRLGFDFGSSFCNDRAHPDSPCNSVEIRLNILFCTTNTGIRRVFTDEQVDQGAVSRFILVRMPDELGMKPAECLRMTEMDRRRLDMVVEKLKADTFVDENTLNDEIFVDMDWLYPDVRRFCEKMRLRAVELGSLAHDLFYRRASSIAFRGATLIYYMYRIENELFPEKSRSEKWIKKKTKAFYLWLADYILCNNVDYWGETLEAISQQGPRANSPKNLLNKLPKEFSTDLLADMLRSLGQSTPPKVRICVWKRDGLIEEIGEKLYRKI